MSRFIFSKKTVETVAPFCRSFITSLKRGVNKNGVH